MLLLLFQRYTGACSRLLVQYKAAFKQVEGGEYPTVESFMKKNKVSVPIISKIRVVSSMGNDYADHSNYIWCIFHPHGEPNIECFNFSWTVQLP